MAKKMTPKQKLFCDEYLVDLNATQAAIRAGYSKKTAKVIGNENLTKPYIQEYIQKNREKLGKKLEITKEMILEGYRRLAFYDMRKFYDENGNLLQVSDLDEETSFALAGFEVTEEKDGNGKGQQVVIGYTKKIKTSDRKAALDSLCKVLGYNAPQQFEPTESFLDFLKETSE